MNLDLTGKRALVCGSTQGIGKATAIELALLGASVTLLARNEEKLQLVLQELSLQNGQLHDFLIADFTDPLLLTSIIENYIAKNKVHIHLGKNPIKRFGSIQYNQGCSCKLGKNPCIGTRPFWNYC